MKFSVGFLSSRGRLTWVLLLEFCDDPDLDKEVKRLGRLGRIGVTAQDIQNLEPLRLVPSRPYEHISEQSRLYAAELEGGIPCLGMQDVLRRSMLARKLPPMHRLRCARHARRFRNHPDRNFQPIGEAGQCRCQMLALHSQRLWPHRHGEIGQQPNLAQKIVQRFEIVGLRWNARTFAHRRLLHLAGVHRIVVGTRRRTTRG